MGTEVSEASSIRLSNNGLAKPCWGRWTVDVSKAERPSKESSLKQMRQKSSQECGNSHVGKCPEVLYRKQDQARRDATSRHCHRRPRRPGAVSPVRVASGAEGMVENGSSIRPRYRDVSSPTFAATTAGCHAYGPGRRERSGPSNCRMLNGGGPGTNLKAAWSFFKPPHHASLLPILPCMFCRRESAAVELEDIIWDRQMTSPIITGNTGALKGLASADAGLKSAEERDEAADRRHAGDASSQHDGQEEKESLDVRQVPAALDRKGDLEVSGDVKIDLGDIKGVGGTVLARNTGLNVMRSDSEGRTLRFSFLPLDKPGDPIVRDRTWPTGPSGHGAD
ncbi:hypothetical protein NM208_g13528 [Fusarium decemcellulare]|uniref:Uncharacterized protein n=1 Tax=Fusarium decemcellulare TaxID=57161 RepID=A0ACC1RKV6_9HYPO|nr:hypothetical protein NM208_g13528 [Fusarium decemcellulare]